MLGQVSSVVDRLAISYSYISLPLLLLEHSCRALPGKQAAACPRTSNLRQPFESVSCRV